MRDAKTARLPKRKTCRRYDTPGHAHALTFSCFGRKPFLSRPRSCEWMIDAIDTARRVHRFDLWAFVIMPEHVHLLICPAEPEYSISRILTTLKRPIARRAVAFVRASAPGYASAMTDQRPNGSGVVRFWQRGGGYDRNLWSPGYIWQTIDYIHDNPVRRGLCNDPSDWPWSSARAYADADAGPMQLDFASLPSDPRRR